MKLKSLIYSAIYITLICLTGCVTDDRKLFPENVEDEIIFTGFHIDSKILSTRVPDKSTPLPFNPYNMDFYIQLITENNEGENITEVGTYVIASGTEGRFNPKEGYNPLTWKSLRKGHTFYSWNFPTGGNKDYNSENPYEKITDPSNIPSAKIYFKDSKYGENYNRYKNNNIYETFIGTKEGPVNYVDNGTYVPLIFRHLVSIIKIDKVTLIIGGSKHEQIEADMTIYGIPTEATFYPRSPKDTDSEYVDYNNDWPVVVPAKAKNDDELTFYIANKNEADKFYIAPEVDFSQLSFSISLLNNNYAEMRDYFGTFENVTFERKGKDWDNSVNNRTDDDRKILHAGELMALEITLYPTGDAGIIVRIEDWSEHELRDAGQQYHSGIYSDLSFTDIVNAFNSNDESSIENLFELYGENNDNEKVFNLYENVTYQGNNLNISSPYVLDGHDHLITITSKDGTVTVGNLRNVYISDGTKYIYIDSEGNIFTVDSETFLLSEVPIGELNSPGPTTFNFSNGSIS